MNLTKSSKIEARDSPIHGRGVFATSDIEPGEILEECHFITLETPTQDPNLFRYVFCWPMRNTNCHAVVFGLGSMFNHSDNNDATWVTDEVNRVYRFIAVKFIPAGKEILINYMT
jgi:SET domain-containing protein